MWFDLFYERKYWKISKSKGIFMDFKFKKYEWKEIQYSKRRGIRGANKTSKFVFEVGLLVLEMLI